MSDILKEARSKIEAALVEIGEESKRLEKALSHLVGADRASLRKPSRKPRAKRPGTPPRKRKRQARKGQRREEVLKAITENPGTTAAKVAKKLDMNPSQVHAIAKALLDDKLVAKKGASYTAKPQTEAKKAEHVEAKV